MTFKPEHPFSNYSKGYHTFNKISGRHEVTLYDKSIGTKRLSRARYNMCVNLGYEPDSNIHVDHINEDKTNDSIENLQLLTHSENVKKHFDFRRNWEPMKEKYICSECNSEFIEDHGIAIQRKKQSISGDLFCSMDCSLKSRAKLNTLTTDQQDEIRELRLRGFTLNEIKDRTGYCPATILKYQPPGFKFAKVSEEKINHIKTLLVQGRSVNSISKELNADKATIRKYR